MKRYFKGYAECDIGPGVAYLEFTEDWPSRQAEIFGDGKIWWWGDLEHPEWLGDQPLSHSTLGPESEIDADEFEQVWQQARKINSSRENEWQSPVWDMIAKTSASDEPKK